MIKIIDKYKNQVAEQLCNIISFKNNNKLEKST